MFTNPIGNMFGKGDGEEKKKKRNKKSKKNLSPEVSEESNPSLNNSKTDLSAVAAEAPSVLPEESAASSSGLMDIVNEINNNPQVDEPVETKYEELPVEESTMQTIIDTIQKKSPTSEAPAIEECWETMLSEPQTNDETAWESEVAAAPQAIDSVWEEMLSSPVPEVEAGEQVAEEAAPVEEVSAWEQMIATPEPEVDADKEAYVSQFNLSEDSYALVKEFYEENKESQNLLKNALLKHLFLNALETREELKEVTEEDVTRALTAIDSDHDEKINMSEFIQLLSLFFSSKNNLQERIAGVLESMSSSHAKKGFLSPKEASGFTNFLNEFYGKAEEQEEEKTVNFLARIIKKIINRKKDKKPDDNQEEEIDYVSFTAEAAEDLENHCFVKF